MPRRKLSSWSQAVENSSVVVGLMLLAELFDSVLGFSLDRFGIAPRTISGLIGVVCSPMLHANGAHLMANAFPLFILLILLFWDRKYHPERTLAIIWVASGLGTWLIGRGEAIHIGASSLIYGLVVYLIASGWWMRNWRSIVVAALVFLFYGGIFYGVLPQRGPVSWEGHLAGAIAGWWAAKRAHG